MLADIRVLQPVSESLVRLGQVLGTGKVINSPWPAVHWYGKKKKNFNARSIDADISIVFGLEIMSERKASGSRGRHQLQDYLLATEAR